MKTTPMSDELYDFVIRHSPIAHPILPEVVEATMQRRDRNMQIAQDQGAFMKMICQVTNARRIVEVGCYTGYSAIAMASGIAPFGKLITIDKKLETATIAKAFFKRAGLSQVIEQRIGDAEPELQKLVDEYGQASFDLGFIDADKQNLEVYFEQVLKLVRCGGLVLVDNTVWSGKVVDKNDQSEDTVAIRRFCERRISDDRVDRVMLHISDGIYIFRKR